MSDENRPPLSGVGEPHDSRPIITPRAELQIDNIIDINVLYALSRAKGDTFYTLVLDDSIPPGHMGYTRLDEGAKGTIHIGTYEASRKTKAAIEGFLIHEVGHHHPTAEYFQNKTHEYMTHDMPIPSQWATSPEATQRFLQALHANPWNAAADIFMEAIMSRHNPPVQLALEALYREMHVGDDDKKENYKNMSKPDQLIQILVGEARYGFPTTAAQDTWIQEAVDPEVYAAYQRLKGAMARFRDAGPFSPLNMPELNQQLIDHNLMEPYKELVREYIKLMEKEVAERKQQRQQEKNQNNQQDQAEGQNQQGAEQGSESNSSTPLTDEEIEEIREQLLDELQKSGEQAREDRNGQQMTQEEAQKLAEDIQKAAQERQRQQEAQQRGELPETPKDQPPQPERHNFEQITRQIQQSSETAHEQEEAEKYGIPVEVYRKWQEIKERRKDIIEELATKYAEILRLGRKPKMKYGQYEGVPTPGLEDITLNIAAKGDTPATYMHPRRIQTPMNVDSWYLVDCSGSMKNGVSDEGSLELLIIDAEAKLQAMQILTDEGALSTEEIPFKLGVTGFTETATKICGLDEDFREHAQQIAARIVYYLNMLNGGTNEVPAIGAVYDELCQRPDNTLKIMTIMTDGYGNLDEVQRLIRRIQQEQNVLVLVLALGSDSQVEQTYQAAIDPSLPQTLFVYHEADVEQIIRRGVDFIEIALESKKEELGLI